MLVLIITLSLLLTLLIDLQTIATIDTDIATEGNIDTITKTGNSTNCKTILNILVVLDNDATDTN